MFPSLTSARKAMLGRAGITTQTELLALTTQELSKKLKVTSTEALDLRGEAIASLAPRTYSSVRQTVSKTFTTGDALLDQVLGGGIRIGAITELTGESASGKTQLALQLSLLVQLPTEKGGLSGSACYLTTNGALPTSRLVEMAQMHPLMAAEDCNLANIHTRPTSSLPELRHILSKGIPELAQRLFEARSTHPLNLLILDSMSALFRSDAKMSSKTLFERSRELNEIALMLHRLASVHHLAVLVINEVNSIFERVSTVSGHPEDKEPDQIFYSEQSQWFSRCDSLPSEGLHEAGLGLVWANQVGLRVMLTRTGRRRHVNILGDAKRPRYSILADQHLKNDQNRAGEATLVRRLSVIFSAFSQLQSIDFAILRTGVFSIGDKQ